MTLTVRAHVFALDVTARQCDLLESMADGRRFAYNWATALNQDLYAADLPPADWEELEPGWDGSTGWNVRRRASESDLATMWKGSWRALSPWNHAAGQPARVAFADHANALSAAIKRKGGFPSFSSRFDGHQGFSTFVVSLGADDTVKIPNLPPLRIHGSFKRLRWFLQNRAGRLVMAHLTRDGVHRPWHCSLIIEVDLPEDERVGTRPIVGLDLGLSVFAALSDGTVVENPRILAAALKRLRHAQKSVARSEQDRQKREADLRARGLLGTKERLSKGKRHLAKEAVVSRIYARMTALRREFHHRVANDLVSRYSIIGLESLNVAGMIQNRRLARSISDAGWSSFLRILAYKAAEAGVLLVPADRWFASSQICSACGTKNPALKDLSIREWTCINPECGVTHQRDLNAALNLVPDEQAIAAALTAREAQRAKTAADRQHKQARLAKSIAVRQTKAAIRKVEKEAKREARRTERAARQPIARVQTIRSPRLHFSLTPPVAGTSTETLNAHRGSVRPYRPTPSVDRSLARPATSTPPSREDVRTAAADPWDPPRDDISLGALGAQVVSSE
jgi:putative transposase